MPVIVDALDHDAWLDADGHDGAPAAALLRPYPSAAMVARPVGPYVNRAANDDPKCEDPVDEDGAVGLLL
jgi:putative SOS response-associated peptidase YedK